LIIVQDRAADRNHDEALCPQSEQGRSAAYTGKLAALGTIARTVEFRDILKVFLISADALRARSAITETQPQVPGRLFQNGDRSS
jgi:hypothetical protein